MSAAAAALDVAAAADDCGIVAAGAPAAAALTAVPHATLLWPELLLSVLFGEGGPASEELSIATAAVKIACTT
jgi:hypothetical protein